VARALEIREGLVLPAEDLTWTAARGSGPGGQNVNKVASRVDLRFDLAGTRALDEGTRSRLRTLARGRLDADGRIRITSERTRDQARNLEDARDKLRALVLRALEPPRPRRPTRPTASSRRRRLEEKRRRGQKKQDRRGSE
jgi:ribosome-associated protein